MFQRQLFICSAIEQCKETVNCCPHKAPHIKDERCVPRECRYAPGAEIDCVKYPVETAPSSSPQKPVIPPTPTEELFKKAQEKKEETPAQEQDIKAAVKKQSAAPKKVAGKKGKGS